MTRQHSIAITIACTIFTLAVSSSQAQPEPPVDDIEVTPLVQDADGNLVPATSGETAIAADEAPLAFSEELSEEETKAYAATLRGYVTEIRGVALEKIAAKLEAKQGKRLGHVATVLFGVSLLGGLLLLAPLVLRRRFPNQGRLLFRYGALAALLFFLAVNLFAAVLMTMRGAQTVTGKYTNPQVRLVDATFDLFYKKAEDIAPVGKSLIEPTLESLRSGGESPALVRLLENVQKLAEDFTVFSSVAKFFSRIDFLLGLLPLILIGLAILLFAQAARPTLVEIVRIPVRAASGQRGVGRQAVRVTLRAVWQEAKSTLCVIGVILAITVMSGLILSMVLMPVLEVFLAYLVVALMYVQVVDAASSFWVLFSLISTIMFLAVTAAVIIIGSAFYLSKAQKMFQMRFRDGVPLRAHGRFWKWGTASLVWSQILPLVYMKAFILIIGWIVLKTLETKSWPIILGGGPFMFLLSFGLVFWAAKGFKALAFMARYKPAAAATNNAIGDLAPTIPVPQFHADALGLPPAPTLSAPRPAGPSLHEQRPAGRGAPTRDPHQAPTSPSSERRHQGWPFD